MVSVMDEDELYLRITKGVRKPKHKVALFLCGSSGVGKTTSKEEFIKDAGLKTTFVTLNLDDTWKYSNKKGNTRELFNRLVSRVIDDGYSFMYDGTCRSYETTIAIIKSIQDKGYTVKVGLVYASLETAIRRIKERMKEQQMSLHTGREIYKQVSAVAEKFMGLDELYLYSNEQKLTLLFDKKNGKIHCHHPEMKFYFDVKPYCS